MNYTISHLGVPIGTVDLPPVETTAGLVTVTAAYAAVHATVLAASEVLWAAGFLADHPCPTDSPDLSALSRAQALPLELRDELGVFAPVDFVNIVERPNPNEPPVAFVRFRHTSTAVPGTLSPAEKPGGESVQGAA